MGYRAILADSETRIADGGEQSFAAAREIALAYLRERIARRRDDNPQRLANLRLAVLRITAQRMPQAPRRGAGNEPEGGP